MKVLHINTNRGGGAALCAFRISEAMLRFGIDSQVIVAGGEPTDKYSVALKDPDRWQNNRWTRKIKYWLLRIGIFGGKEQMEYQLHKTEVRTNSYIFAHLPLSDYKNLSQHPLVKEADIIHLHWVSGFIDYPSFFKEVKKPIVWTLHDKYPAIGLQHYSSKFFPLPKSLEEIDRTCRRIKRRSMLQHGNIHLVAISEYMEQLCTTSEVLAGFPTTLIHNGVDTTVFKPTSKELARKALNLPDKTSREKHPYVFMVCGCDISDSNKGLVRVISALESWEETNKILICVGPKPAQKRNASFPIIYLGTINDQEELSRIYSSADFFILASYEETFAQTPLEAMACGRPVISTPCFGASDLIRPINGILCPGFDPEDLCFGIKQAINTEYSEDIIRNYILENYTYQKIGRQYFDLYQSIFDKQ